MNAIADSHALGFSFIPKSGLVEPFFVPAGQFGPFGQLSDHYGVVASFDLQKQTIVI
jgi:hypothetical protein